MSVDYSIIIPAYNEENFLPATLKATQHAMSTVDLCGEIVVVDNNSSDATAAVAETAGAIVVFEAHNQISRARNAGATKAQGRYLFFVDADTTISPELLEQALSNLESGECCGGGATVTSDRKLPLVVQGLLGYWNLLSRVFRLAAGCFVYARRDDFERSGGFSEKLYATEEVWFSIALKRAGRRERRKFRVINQPKVVTSDRKLGWFSSSYQLMVLFMVFLMPLLTRFRWFCGYWYKRPQS